MGPEWELCVFTSEDSGRDPVFTIYENKTRLKSIGKENDYLVNDQGDFSFIPEEEYLKMCIGELNEP